MKTDPRDLIVHDSNELGDALRSARRRQGLTQQDLADLSKVGVRFLSELERGKETAELGLTLQVLQHAGYEVMLRKRTTKTGSSDES